MSEPFALDEAPSDDTTSDVDGKVQCPECDNRYKPSGLQRHITMSHRGGIPDGGSSTNKGKAKTTIVIEARWADFQRGVAMITSLACTQCASAIAEDAEKDAVALSNYCQNKPKFRKQLEDFLSTTDFLMLVGAFGGTAQKCLAHHSIGKRIPGVIPVENTGHANHDPASKMMEFMGGLPQEQRHQMMDQIFEATKQQPQPVQQPEPEYVATGAGAEPVPEPVQLTEHDRAIQAAMHSGSDFMETVGSLQ